VVTSTSPFARTTRGSEMRLEGDGGDYLTAVHRRRGRYFVGPSNSPTWATLSEYRRHGGIVA
jgi:hypothetical protein